MLVRSLSHYLSRCDTLANTQSYLEYLINRLDFTKDLNTPDGSRKIIDTQEKVLSLRLLSAEVNNLALAVYGEGLDGIANSIYGTPSMDSVRKWLSEQRLAG
tara:strand:+ start:4858 stop:5163 length:306 start_codon:yes stop_codon:yes gene_type:complete